METEKEHVQRATEIAFKMPAVLVDTFIMTSDGYSVRVAMMECLPQTAVEPRTCVAMSMLAASLLHKRLGEILGQHKVH